LIALAEFSVRRITGVAIQIDDTFAHTNQIAYREGTYKLIIGRAGDPTIYKEPFDDWMNGQRTFIDRFFESICDFFKTKIFPDDEFLGEHYFTFFRHQILNLLGWQPPSSGVFLFDIEKDPTESQNIADQNPKIVAQLKQKVEELKKKKTSTM